MSLRSLLAKLPPRPRLYVATAIYGVAGGGIAVAFHQCIHLLYGRTFETWAVQSPETFAWRTLALMLAASLAAGLLLHFAGPSAAGSGIPQLKLAYWKEFGWSSPRIMWVKFVAGALSIGSGMSLGREGPSVQMAGTMGSAIATRLGLAKAQHRMPAAAGAAAGLAAAFNTPLAAVTFVLEEIIGDLNSRILGTVLMASMIGALVVHGLLGTEPAFRMQVPNEPGWQVYVLTPWVAACATLTGLLFQRGSLNLRGWSRSQRRLPVWALPVVGAFLTWVIGILVWKQTGRLGVFSLGYNDLSDALSGRLAWELAALLLVAKLLATVLCYGLGGCGGIFSPTLFFGGMAGLAAAGLGQMVLPMPLHEGDQVVLAVVGMCACLGAVVRAPVTGILIVFEMTHQFSLVLPLMLGVLVSQAISRRMMRSNFYEEVLEQDGHHLNRIIPPRDLGAWQNLPASAIANFHPESLTDIGAESMRAAFDGHPYSNFPVLRNSKVVGVLTRHEIERALISNAEPMVEPAVIVDPQESIRVIQSRIIDSRAGMVVLCDEKQALLGVVTLHDLLRAQLAYGKVGED
ncbi:MAG: chloride channel protein [Prosthecobacter sp.]|uniref:chloride channel protein n=1 Tax=Prosthecobacter sp. TaxID=1965333 RepID=UPI002608AC43|nr:chloride channel protein [Prosthecobacter sp.]MCF7788916.1 chloride channel protein [Prosthecobacter sp.]